VRVVSKEAVGGKDLRGGLRKLQITTSINLSGGVGGVGGLGGLGGVSVSSSGTERVSATLSNAAGVRPFSFNTVGGSTGVLTTSNPPFGPSVSGRISASSNNNDGGTGIGGGFFRPTSTLDTIGNFQLP
jgi:hypothetical protein